MELNKLNRKVRAKEKKIKSCLKVKQETTKEKESLEAQRKEFLKQIKFDPLIKETVEVREDQNLIV